MPVIHSYIDSTLAQLQPVIESTAKNLLRHLQDDPIAQAQETFADFETLHRHIVQALAVEIMNQALQQQADRLDALPTHQCPSCSQTTRRRPMRNRQLQTDSGTVRWNETECFCEHCRKAFFPSDGSTPA